MNEDSTKSESLYYNDLGETKCASFDRKGRIITSDDCFLNCIDTKDLNDTSCSINSMGLLKEKFNTIFAFEEYDDNKWILIGIRADEDD